MLKWKTGNITPRGVGKVRRREERSVNKACKLFQGVFRREERRGVGNVMRRGGV